MANDEGFDPTDRGRWAREGSTARPPAGDDLYESDWSDDLYGPSASDEDFYEPVAAGRTGFFHSMWARWLALVALLAVLVAIVALSVTGDDGDGDATAEVSAEDEPTGAGDSEAEGPGDGKPVSSATTGHPALDALFRALGIEPDLDDPRVRRLVDAAADHLDSISTNTPGYTGADIDLAETFAGLLAMPSDIVDLVFNRSTVPCGAQAPFAVICAEDVVPMPAGEVLMLGMILREPPPDGSPERSYIYSAVFDTDGDPANDWRPQPPFDFDLFQGADRWYQLSWDHVGGAWRLEVNQVDAGQQISVVVGSAARVVVTDSAIVFLVPASEVEGSGAYRLTAFGHDGQFSESTRGADVSGADPTEPLAEPPDEPIEAGVPAEG